METQQALVVKQALVIALTCVTFSDCMERASNLPLRTVPFWVVTQRVVVISYRLEPGG
jgi:hypothetical protein